MKRAAAASALILSMTAVAASAQTSPAAKSPAKGDSCFYITQLEANHALNDRSVLLRVNISDYYRLDFANRCVALTYPTPKLILTPFGGDDLVCHAIDLDVKVSDQGPGAIPEPCIPSTLRKLTPAEVAAIPKKDLP